MWSVGALLSLVLMTINVADSTRVVCYYTNWAQYRSSKGKFVPENVDPSMCTHVMYAFAKPSGTDIQTFEWNDDSTAWSKGMFERMMDIKKKNPSVKVLLAIGGFNLGSGPFMNVVQSQATRTAFAQSAVSFLRQRNFDGLDVDWEYPAARGSPAQDKQNFALLMQELMQTFQREATISGKPRLLLTGAFPAGKDKIDNGYDLPTLSRTMDFVNLMTYDLHGSWEKQTGIHSPLFAHQQDTGDDSQLNLDWVAKYYVSKGVPKDKLVIGLATYGRSFTLANPANSGVNAPAPQAGQEGRYTREKGFISYYEICEMLQSGAQSYDVPSQRSKYLVQGSQWVGYDDVQTITEKACYVKENGYSGIMFWALDLDDFTGQTCRQGRYPLMKAAIRELSQPSLANCVRRTTTGGQSTVQPVPGVVTYRPTPFPSIYATQRPTFQPSNALTYKPTPFPSIYATQRPTFQPSITLQPSNPQQPFGPRPTGYVPINPPPGFQGNPPTNVPSTNAPVTNAPVTYAPVYTPKPYNPVNPATNAPINTTPQNPYAFTLPTYGVNTPKPPNGVTLLPGSPTQPPVTTAPIVTNAPVVNPGTAAPTSGQSQAFDCRNRISDFYPDPVSCDHFYICANKVTYRVPCAYGLKYNTLAKHCDWSYNVKCQGRPSLPSNNGGFPNIYPNGPTPAPTLAPTQVPTKRPVTAAPQNPPSATTVCANQITGYKPHATDCHKFYQCSNQIAYEMNCPPKLVFNPAKTACDHPLNVPGCP